MGMSVIAGMDLLASVEVGVGELDRAVTWDSAPSATAVHLLATLLGGHPHWGDAAAATRRPADGGGGVRHDCAEGSSEQ